MKIFFVLAIFFVVLLSTSECKPHRHHKSRSRLPKQINDIDNNIRKNMKELFEKYLYRNLNDTGAANGILMHIEGLMDVVEVTLKALSEQSNTQFSPKWSSEKLDETQSNLLQLIKTSGFAEKWHPDVKICYDQNYPWIFILCDFIDKNNSTNTRKLIESNKIIKEITDLDKDITKQLQHMQTTDNPTSTTTSPTTISPTTTSPTTIPNPTTHPSLEAVTTLLPDIPSNPTNATDELAPRILEEPIPKNVLEVQKELQPTLPDPEKLNAAIKVLQILTQIQKEGGELCLKYANSTEITYGLCQNEIKKT